MGIKKKQILNIPIVQEYKYLGITLNKKLGFESHFKTIKKKL